MAATCASCGAEEPVGARFCSSCGAALAQRCAVCGAALAPAARRVAPAGGHEERRVVTVLFADLAGSTALGERLDPEDVRVLQGELFELVNGAVERHGGTTEKFIGDASGTTSTSASESASTRTMWWPAAKRPLAAS